MNLYLFGTKGVNKITERTLSIKLFPHQDHDNKEEVREDGDRAMFDSSPLLREKFSLIVLFSPSFQRDQQHRHTLIERLHQHHHFPEKEREKRDRESESREREREREVSGIDYSISPQVFPLESEMRREECNENC